MRHKIQPLYKTDPELDMLILEEELIACESISQRRYKFVLQRVFGAAKALKAGSERRARLHLAVGQAALPKRER